MKHQTDDEIEVAAIIGLMSLQGELARFERLLREQFPGVLQKMNPGLDDTGIGRFRRALLPMRLTDEIETLYRWRDGGNASPFAGWMLVPSELVLRDREFYLGDLEEPPAWLRIFDDQCIGFASLEVPGYGIVPGVWYGHTHDGWISRLFVSVESLIAACADAISSGQLHLFTDGTSPIALRLTEQSSLDSPDFTPFRTAREPVTFVYPDPPAGTYIGRSPENDWPSPWLASLGLDPTPPTPRGVTHSIAELIELSEHGDASGTISGTVVRFGGWAHEWIATVDDGTGQLALIGKKQVLNGASMGDTAEFDVELDSASRRAKPGYNDPHAQQRSLTHGMIPGAPARSTAVRLNPS